MTVQQPLAPGGKPAIQSVTIISGVVMFACSAAGFAGYAISESDQAQLISLINSGYAAGLTIVGMVSSAAAIWGRIRATHQITSVVAKT